MQAVQHFSDDCLARSRTAGTEQVLTFLEAFRLLQQPDTRPSKVRGLRVPETLLGAFRRRCELEGAAYQAQIRVLMRRWLAGSESAR